MTDAGASTILRATWDLGPVTGLLLMKFSALENIRPLILAQGLTDEATHAQTLATARQEVARNRSAVTYYVAYGQPRLG